MVPTAMYLVGQGPYRQPRLIEVQYLRLQRYISALEEVLKEGLYVDDDDAYIDINYPREDMSLQHLPGLARLLEQISSGKYRIVLVDLEIGQPFAPYKHMPILNTLRSTGVRVYNCFYDDEEALRNQLTQRFGISRNEVWRFLDEWEDFVALFPALTAHIVQAALTDDVIYRDERLSRIVTKLRNSNPYQQGGIPWFSSNQHKRLIDFPLC